MSNTVKHGTSGSIPLTGKGGDKPIYSLNQLAYLLPRYDKVKRIYRFLKSVHNHFVNQSNYFSLRKICEAHNISFHVIGVLKKMKVITNDKWIYTYLPNWALAVDIQIAYWQIQAKQKKYKKEMFKKLELYGINKSILQRGDKLTEENDMLVIRNKGVIVSKYNKVSKKGEVFNRL